MSFITDPRACRGRL